jgi:hypothetical protein
MREEYETYNPSSPCEAQFHEDAIRRVDVTEDVEIEQSNRLGYGAYMIGELALLLWDGNWS